MKKLVLMVALCGLSLAASAQNKGGQLKFSETTIDVGRIWEDRGKVTRDVIVTNLSEYDVNILSSQAAKPSVTLKWDKTALKKNDKIHLKVTVDPKGINYSFRIPVTIVTLCNKDTVRYNLMAAGYVDPAPTTKEEAYTMQEGNLKYKDNSVTPAKMHRNEVRTDTIWFLNVWDSVMTFKPGNLPPAIKIVYLTKELKPQQEGFVVFSYSAAVKNDWGPVFDQFTLITNDPIPNDHHNTKKFYFVTDIYDDFGSWSKEQLLNAPHVLIDTEEYHFGQCIMGDVITHDFVLTNIGKSPLVVHKVKTSCGCTTSDLEKDTIAPGESTKIKARFSTYNKHGGQAKEIFLITNDPDQPKVTMRIMGHVLDKPKQ
jgi:hypothetical protein